MTIFRLKQLASSSANAVAGSVRWNYDRAELIADGVPSDIAGQQRVIEAYLGEKFARRIARAETNG